MDNHNTIKEIWKDIKGYEGYYQVSNLGKVRSLDRVVSNGDKRKGKTLKPSTNKRGGYLFVRLSQGGGYNNHYVHRLVAQSFVPNDQNNDEVDHLDSNKLNNKASNLEWVTRAENMQRSWESGLMENQRESARESGKRLAKKVVQIDKAGKALKEYKSQTQASEETGIPAPNISMCCTGERKNSWRFCLGVFRLRFSERIGTLE